MCWVRVYTLHSCTLIRNAGAQLVIHLITAAKPGFTEGVLPEPDPEFAADGVAAAGGGDAPGGSQGGGEGDEEEMWARGS